MHVVDLGDGSVNPLHDPDQWPRLLDAVGPAWLLVASDDQAGY
jgi:hypothetical protein